MFFFMVMLALPALPAHADPCSGSGLSIVQAFPTGGAEQTRWEISACTVNPHGLVIGPTYFRTSPSASLVQVLQDARVSEALVVYHNGTTFFDISEQVTGISRLGDAECPASRGVRLDSNRICKEIRDRGLAWKDSNRTGARRGEELVLWGVVEAANYLYIIEWAFRDDGVIVGRVGATGRNLAFKHVVGHMHTVTWRLDIDLDGPAGDSVRLGLHKEGAADDSEKQLTKEGGQLWNDLEFTTLHIYDASLVNSQGKPTSYRLVPWRSGTARHSGLALAYTRKDFWVTQFVGPKTTGQMEAKNLPTYVTGQSIVDTDVIVWYNASVHHVERDEDDTGPTQAMYFGFELRPHDLFGASPLFP
jgi:Cu2+-containing amine oxidase